MLGRKIILKVSLLITIIIFTYMIYRLISFLKTSSTRTKKKIIFSILLLIICTYLFNTRKIEVFDFKDEKVVNCSLIYKFNDSDIQVLYLEDREFLNDLISRIKKEDYRGRFEFKLRILDRSHGTDGFIMIRVHTVDEDDFSSYIFDIDGIGRIDYRQNKTYKDKAYGNRIYKRIKIGLWDTKEIKELYNELKIMIEEEVNKENLNELSLLGLINNYATSIKLVVFLF
ncbi:MAG: hypothetical protein AB2375_02750 [Tissierellaceae bacterium]